MDAPCVVDELSQIIGMIPLPNLLNFANMVNLDISQVVEGVSSLNHGIVICASNQNESESECHDKWVRNTLMILVNEEKNKNPSSKKHGCSSLVRQ